MPTRTPTRVPTRALSYDEPVSIKLLVLGVASVGKSSLLLRLTDQKWLPEGEINPTIGVDTLVKMRSINRDGKKKVGLTCHMSCRSTS
jgi:GTPase SAR1 family protein